MLNLDRDDTFRAAVARETAHAAVAEHLGFEVCHTEIDWRGFPVCRYRGALDASVNPRDANLLILLAGPVGERISRGQAWRTPDGDIDPWMGQSELDPGDHPDSAFDVDLVLALRTVDGDVATLHAIETEAHRLLAEEPIVGERWRALQDELLRRPAQPD